MTPATEQAHLTDAQFADLLAGEQPDSMTGSHLATCELCRAELSAVGISLQDLSTHSAQWAELAAPVRVPAPSRWARSLGGRMPWAAGLAVTALTGLLAFVLSLHRHPQAVPQHPLASSAPSNADLVNDNRMLLSISQELTYHAQSAVPADELHEGAHDDSQQHSPAVVN